MSITNQHREQDRTRWWEIHDKDTYICPDCGKTADEEGFRGWEVHHIDAEPGNVVGLCYVCHWVRHGSDRRDIDLEAWKDEFLAVGG